MSGKLAQEIKQTKPFASIEEEAALNLARTAESLQAQFADFLKPFELTPTQYNMLRILRGAGSEGVTCSQATERMLTSDPDITRLLDRMQARKLIRRERSTSDRRVVITHITAVGLALANEIDRPILEFHKRTMGRVGKQKLQELIDTLETLRTAPQ